MLIDNETLEDAVVDLIEALHFLLATVMPLQDADLCWHYLVEHYYKGKPYAEA
jgi:hypothetical protein